MYKRFNTGSGFLTSPYLMALLAPTVVSGAMQVTWPFFEHNAIALYLLAVIFCAWYGGLGPGLFSVCVSFLLSDFFFVEPYSLFQFHKQGDLVRVVLFVIIGPTISLLSELMHRERRRSIVNLNAMRASEERYRKLAENFPNGAVVTYDKDFRITFIAGRGLQNGGTSPDSCVGKLLSEVAPPEVVAVVEPHFQTAFGGQTATYECSHPDGKTSLNAAAPLLDENGFVKEILVISQDTTERKRVERAQRESQLQYETLVQSIDSIVWEADPKTFTFTFVSKQAERILGYPLERWFEGPEFWPDHMHPDDRDWAVAFCVTATAKLEDHQFEYRMIAADGQVVWLTDIVSVHVLDDQSVILRGVMVDITERKRAEEKLRQSESQLAEAQRLASIGSWNWDIRNNTNTWSDELYRIFGLDPQESEPSYNTFIQLVHPDDRAMESV